MNLRGALDQTGEADKRFGRRHVTCPVVVGIGALKKDGGPRGERGGDSPVNCENGRG